MDFDEVIRRRRMVRHFSERPVDADVLDSVLDAARRGPSAGFSQGVDLLVLEGPAETRQFFELTSDPGFLARPGAVPGALGAPVIVVPLGDPDAYVSALRGEGQGELEARRCSRRGLAQPLLARRLVLRRDAAPSRRHRQRARGALLRPARRSRDAVRRARRARGQGRDRRSRARRTRPRQLRRKARPGPDRPHVGLGARSTKWCTGVAGSRLRQRGRSQGRLPGSGSRPGSDGQPTGPGSQGRPAPTSPLKMSLPTATFVPGSAA